LSKKQDNTPLQYREEEIRNTKHEIRNNIKTRMLEWSKQKGMADDADCR